MEAQLAEFSNDLDNLNLAVSTLVSGYDPLSLERPQSFSQHTKFKGLTAGHSQIPKYSQQDSEVQHHFEAPFYTLYTTSELFLHLSVLSG